MGAASDVVVRMARVEDADAIARIHIASWRHAYADVMDRDVLAQVDPRRRAEAWRGWITGPGAVAVAERAGRLVGFVSYGANPDDDPPGLTGEVYTIYLDPQVVGTGVGAALMNHAVAELAASGFPEAVLWVLETNPRARSFYERGGWRPDGAARDETLGGGVLHVVRYRRPLP